MIEHIFHFPLADWSDFDEAVFFPGHTGKISWLKGGTSEVVETKYSLLYPNS